MLESHGWSIHRVWSTDWFQRPNEQLELIISKIETSKEEYDAAATGKKANRAVPFEIVSVDREDVTEIGFQSVAGGAPSALYQEAVVSRPQHLSCELHEAPRGALSTMAEAVVDVEGPVHIDEVVNRIRDAWGLKRAGGRIQEAVEMALNVSVHTGRLLRDDDFLSVPGQKAQVRDRSQVIAQSLRRCDTLPPSELELAVLEVVRINFGATDDQVCMAVSRALGFKSTSGQLRDLIAQIVSNLLKKQWIERKNGLLIAGAEAPAAVKTSKPPSALSGLIIEGEHETLEFKETLRWDVVLETANKKLEEVVIKTLAGFANRIGGTLLIGVADSGEVRGLARDYACLGGSRDKMQLHLTNLLTNHFGQAYRASRIRVVFVDYEGEDVCRVDIDRSHSALFVTTSDSKGNPAERFFVRSGNSTQELSPSQSATYIHEHFKT